MTRLSTNAEGVALIKEFEGLRLVAYQDGGGVWTIGWGHTGPDVWPGLGITRFKAEELFGVDLKRAEDGVRRHIKSATPNQFSALVALTFSVGEGQLYVSTLLKLHNDGAFEEAAAEFDRWIYDGGHKIPGLVNRRAAEKELYLK